MVNRLRSFFSLSLIVCYAHLAQASDDMLAMVTDLAGNVDVKHQYGSNQLDLLARLYDQDRLTLKPGSAIVVVHLLNSQEYAIKGPATYLVTEKGLQHVEGGQAKAYSVLNGNAVASDAIRNGNIAYAGLALKGTAPNQVGKPVPIRVLTLKAGKTLNPNPWFKWQAENSEAEFDLDLKNSDGELVWQTRTKASALKLPAYIKLESGRQYTWLLSLAGSQQRLQNTFSMASIEEEKQVRKILEAKNHKFADQVLKASLLESMQFIDESNAIWRKLHRERPGNKALKSKIQAI